MWKPTAGFPPRTTSMAASTMNATIANTLIAESQYSSVPNALTLKRFTPISSAADRRIQAIPGTSGNHISMYVPMAVTSVPTASTMHDQYR